MSPRHTNMSPCTEFCIGLRRLRLTNDTLPSHSQLLEQLPATGEAKRWQIGTWREIQGRSGCEFCRLITATITECTRGTRNNPDQDVEVLLFPNERSFRVSYPSPLGTRLAFVAESPNQICTGGPDIARLLSQEDSIIQRIEGWLQVCNQQHSSCFRRTTSDSPNVGVWVTSI